MISATSQRMISRDRTSADAEGVVLQEDSGVVPQQEVSKLAEEGG